MTNGKNVLLITVDSLRQDHVGCYGYDRDTTPNIDEYAESSHLFSNVFAHGCSTRSSFPTILTSSYPMMYGGFEVLSEDRTLISEVLKEYGYTNFAFHSNPYLSEEFGYARGFDRVRDWQTNPTTTAKIRQLIKDNLEKDGLFYKTIKKMFSLTERKMGVEVGSLYLKADNLTDMAIAQVKDSASTTQNFLWVHYMDVHNPYIPPKEHQLEFRDSPISDHEALRLRRKMLESPDDINKEEQKKLIDLYDAEIRFADKEMNRLIETTESEWSGETIVIITSDHGEELGEHGRYSHNMTFYDEILRVPLIIKSGMRSGKRKLDQTVGLIDVAPTITELTGTPQPDNFHGYSLTCLLEGDSNRWERDHVIGRVPEKGAYVDSTWKYIKNYLNQQEELYNINEDPTETKNLIDNVDKRLVNKFREKLDEHEIEVQKNTSNVEEVELKGHVKQRLRELGYKE